MKRTPQNCTIADRVYDRGDPARFEDKKCAGVRQDGDEPIEVCRSCNFTKGVEGEVRMKHKVPVQSLIDHIKTAIDVDPWAKEMVEELLKEQDNEIDTLKTLVLGYETGKI